MPYRTYRRYMGVPVATFAVATALLAATAHGQISGIVSDDYSSTTSGFLHATTIGPVTTDGAEVSFTHHTQLLNSASYTGGVAQVQKRNSIFVLNFTVEDPSNVGFSLDVDQLLRGYSSLDVQGGRGDATGVSYYVQVDDSTDEPDTFTVDTDLFLGTGGVSQTEPGEVREFFESTKDASLGSYVGTTSFFLSYTTVYSSTTNVFFQNGSVGSGAINYGIGDLAPGDPHSAEDLGHFLTVKVTYVPEPTSLGLLGLSGLILRRRR